MGKGPADRRSTASWPGHERRAIVEIGDQVFRPPLQPLDGGAGQALDEAVGERKAQIGTARLDARQAAAFEHRLQAAPDGFDLG